MPFRDCGRALSYSFVSSRIPVHLPHLILLSLVILSVHYFQPFMKTILIAKHNIYILTGSNLGMLISFWKKTKI